MTPDDAARVRNTFPRAFGAKAAIAARFYEDLFARAPTLRRAFPRDMAVQHVKLSDTLVLLVRHIQRPEAMRSAIEDLAMRHVGYGTLPEHFPIVIDALVGALEREIPGGLDAADGAAWRAAFSWVAEIMAETIAAELAARRAAQRSGVPRLAVSGE